ncbi:long-chain-fatty-acid--CoA ligase [Amycolatopsis sp. NPDC049253]|uniref:long-chain-fatty-acid--CoA ligase n=1 Tax=Amycolatopsis sp. NPDC049253 TaxID=3155274 RepID=UPI00344745C4
MSELMSTMQDFPLTMAAMLRHGYDVHPDSPVVSGSAGRVVRETDFSTVAGNAARLATALRGLGVRPGDRVGTFCCNHQPHLEAFYGVPAMGAVLHLINSRLSDEQLVYVIGDAEDGVIIVDDDLLPRLTALLPRLPSVHTLVVAGEERGEHPGYGELLASVTTPDSWPELDERAPAAVCYTTGTTGLPKGVVYSHRSIWLHALAISSGAAFALSDRDRILQITPMFHVNGWGLPHAALLTGAGIVLPGRDVSAAAVAALTAAAKPTLAVSIPLIWAQVKSYAETHPVDLSSLDSIVCAGSSVAPALIDYYERVHGTNLFQGWGMTEVSPWGGISLPPARDLTDPAKPWRGWSGRLLPGVEMRVVDEFGTVLPRDGESVGELQMRGPWVTGSYVGGTSEDRFSADGWLRTGDLGALDRHGYFRITDRSKDVIKSGGEWISSVALENHLDAHPDVAESAVIGVPDPRWEERPLAVIVLTETATASMADLRGHLAASVPRWWLPERWVRAETLPRTSVGKIDKKRLRAVAASGELHIEHVPGSAQVAGAPVPALPASFRDTEPIATARHRGTGGLS